MKSDLDNFSRTSFLPLGVLLVNFWGIPWPKIITLPINSLVKSGR